MIIMCVPLVELLHQVTMGWIQAHEYMLSGARGLLLPLPEAPVLVVLIQ
jgi:hypothetical protein